MKRFERSRPRDEVVVREALPTYEVRECGRCLDGLAYDSGVPTGSWVPCPDCEGLGKRSVYAYPKKGRRS